MPEQRKSSGEVTPSHEDSGIFRSEIGTFTVELVPSFARNSRNDILLKGYVGGASPIELVIAGRRTAQADPLLRKLNLLWAKAQAAGRLQGVEPQLEDVRCKVRVEGAWRAKFWIDQDGWQTRQHQLFAARWAFVESDGRTATFGEHPVLGPA